MKTQTATLALLAACLMMSPATGLLPAAVPTKLAAGGDGTTVYSYTDPNTGSSAKLVARNGALWCDWHLLDPPTYAGNIFHLVSCWVKPAGASAASAAKGCGTDSNLGNGGAVGSCRLLASMPTGNLQWWMSALAMEAYAEDSTHRESKTVKITEWKVGGDFSASAEASASIAGIVGGALMSASGLLNVAWNFVASGSISSWRSDTTTSDHYIRHRQATVLGLDGAFVNTVAGITSLTLEGDAYGCDALNLVESVKGARQIGTYTNRLKATTLSGTLETDLDQTVLKGITDDGAFTISSQGVHNFLATYSNSGDGTSDGASILASATGALSGQGMKDFNSAIDFEADYEVPDYPLLFNLWNPELDTLLTVRAAPLDDVAGLLVSREDGSRPTVITPSILRESHDNLADAVGKALYDSAPGVLVLKDWTCPPSVGLTVFNAYPQFWSSKATATGFTSTTTATASLNVDVYLDLGPY